MVVLKNRSQLAPSPTSLVCSPVATARPSPPAVSTGRGQGATAASLAKPTTPEPPMHLPLSAGTSGATPAPPPRLPPPAPAPGHTEDQGPPFFKPLRAIRAHLGLFGGVLQNWA
ncbi:arabinogalactan protein 1-like [Cryptomeria japonica]|uniref:arabinogalactan protein 1-like n=1 Tax=Cryptomeria japonica TaxID=3369 RepID=UPI0027D9F049|nr:arabinogalactan protein 1-like [Cryptomeria japonica]